MTPDPDPIPANPEDLRLTLLYALRFGLTGKPHPKGLSDESRVEMIVAHLERCRYVILHRPGRRAGAGMGT